MLSLAGGGIFVSAAIGAAVFYGSAPRIAAELMPTFVPVMMQDGDVLQVATSEVTWGQWQVCVDAKACPDIQMPNGALNDHPVVGVNWYDTQAYIGWLSAATNIEIRLPKQGEWQNFAADHAPEPKEKLFTDPRMAWAADYDITAKPRDSRTKQVGSFGQSQTGLSDLKGNVWEWTSTDCADLGRRNVITACSGAGRIVMGEHLSVLSELVRDPGNASCGGGIPPNNLGFRVVF